MSNSPLIRTAVSLCLIAAMVIQPMAVVAAQGTCAQVFRNGSYCQANTICTACKCCEVKNDGDLCGCCGGSEDDTGDCCTKMAGKSKVDEGALSSCMCGVHSEPVAPLPHRVPVAQIRSFVVIAYLGHVASDTGLAVHSNSATSRLLIGDLSPHFSQRFLCIWRI